MLESLFVLLVSLVSTVYAWPDGAPCVHAAFESMNPLEAVEHQGGLQLSTPPYEIAVDQKCYWRNQPIGLTLQGHNESIWFKGFVIQPFKWNNDQLGERFGQLVRLDDNGSWQQQCFRYQVSATHSHDEKKKHIKMWWKVDDEVDTVQFVATVVKHQTQFWVKSVRSRPLPPCRLNRDGFPNYQAPAPSVPPQVKQFKMETFRVFDSIGAQALEQSLPQQPQFQSAQQQPPQPVSSTTPHMSRIIPVADGFQRANSGDAQVTTLPVTPAPFTQQPAFQQTFRPIPARPRQRIIAQQPQSVFNNRQNVFISRRRGQSNSFSANRQNVFQQPQQSFRGGGQCVDRDPQGRCSQWRQFCTAPSHQQYLTAFCARTCGLCRRH
ncbi:hypothetical protein L5515_008959 [Caenorhabditis briggsae]|uniref:ShKT domain-containing protein n=2 Tax=Caenorhabditis briggsae TaxID=6238 RepID=A0AAE9JN43_CAEBR|nr:hypothetical protein L5515_008959 [Caenorhabditis briggsae]